MRVLAGNRLHYVWFDFFENADGLEWIRTMHTEDNGWRTSRMAGSNVLGYFLYRFRTFYRLSIRVTRKGGGQHTRRARYR